MITLPSFPISFSKFPLKLERAPQSFWSLFELSSSLSGQWQHQPETPPLIFHLSNFSFLLSSFTFNVFIHFHQGNETTGQCAFKSGQPLPSPLSSLTWHQVTYQVIFGTKQCQKPMKYSMLQNGFKLLQCQQLLINLSQFLSYLLPCPLQGVFLHLWLFPAPSPHHLPLLSHDQQASCSGICVFVFLYFSICTH